MTTSLEIAPYFHPTKIVLVDDDIDFLGNLSLQLDADLAYLLFDSTRKALGYINQSRGRGNIADRFLRERSSSPENSQIGEKEQLLEIDSEAVLQEMYFSNRFSQISVVLVDYEMPQMDGLEFCRKIKEPHVKKILFTGVATESLAIDAFNDGVIDRYIGKHEPAVYDMLNQTIRQFQKDYLRDLFATAANMFSLVIPDLLADPGVAQLLEVLRRDHGMVEYYFADAPPDGFFFMNAAGDLKRVVVPTVCDLTTYGLQLAEAKVPLEFVDRILQGGIIPNPNIMKLAGSTSNEQYPSDALQARPMPNGEKHRKWALFDVVLESDYGRGRQGYSEFLEWLDTVGYSLM